ncbi:MAG: tripartite tricarboxylate transporter TctB family protein [Petrotogales bacterium]
MLCLVVGIMFLIISLQYSYLGSIFPAVISSVLIVMSLLLLIKSFTNPEVSEWIKKIKIKNVLCLATGIIIYVIIIPILGIIITSTLYIIIFSLMAVQQIDYRVIVSSIIVASGVSGLFSYVFMKYFYVPLPSGILF